MEHARPPVELNMDGGPVSRADAWKRWRQQFLLFVKAAGVDKEPSSVQASLLVNLIGTEGFDVYQTFTFEKDADRDDVKILLNKFDDYFGSKVNITLLRYKFFTRNQEEGETIQQYVTSLRLLSKNCKFGNLEDDLIKDRIVCGVRSAKIRDRLLRCDDLDLDKAMKVCQADEVSKESGQQINGANAVCASVAHVDSVDKRRRFGSGGRHRGPGGPARAATDGGRARRGAARSASARPPRVCLLWRRRRALR